MSRYIPTSLRELVISRAKNRCEYCLVYDRHSFFNFHIEHIISLQHKGQTTEDNLAYACSVCNYSKGPNVATFIDDSNDPIRFYNPRKDDWNEHFMIKPSGIIEPRTAIGKATVQILDLNHPDSILDRLALLEKGLL